MNVTLWIVAGLLAAAFLAAGSTKIVLPKRKLADTGMGYVEDFDGRTIKAIGILEVLGAVGLVLPPTVGIAPALVPVAAIGLAVLMLGAATTHVRRGEIPMVIPNVVLFAMAACLAWGRLGPTPF